MVAQRGESSDKGRSSEQLEQGRIWIRWEAGIEQGSGEGDQCGEKPAGRSQGCGGWGGQGWGFVGGWEGQSPVHIQAPELSWRSLASTGSMP